MRDVPESTDEYRIICFETLDETTKTTGNCTHRIHGKESDPPFFDGLMVVQFEKDSGFYLFYCDDDWHEITDTYHTTVEDAKAQADFEFTNLTVRWRAVDD